MRKMIKNISNFLLAIAVFTTIFYVSGCSDTTTPTADNVDLSYIGTTDTVDNSGSLVLDTVKILIKDIKLNVSSTNDTNNFKTGPYVLYLNFVTGVTFVGSAYIPPGTYDKLKFEVHKLNDNETPPDPEFVDANGRYSVVVKGTYLGNYFVYKSDKSAHQILAFPSSLHVSASGKTNITLKAEPYIWFIENGLYLDPNDPANRSKIDNNIKDNVNNNFKAFKDDDHNGIPD